MRRKAQAPEYGNSRIFDLTEIRVNSGKNVSHAIVTHCVLYWCVNTYSATVLNNNLNETVLDSWHDPNPSSIEGDTTRLSLRPPGKYELPQDTFGIDLSTTKFIEDWLKRKMIMTNMRVNFCDDMYPVDGESTSEFDQPLLHQGLTNIFKSLANAITIRVREWDWTAQHNLGIPSLGVIGAANGTSLVKETQIHVKWPWIVLPSLLLMMTMVFMGVTVWNTKRMGLEAWKSSPTALVCSGLDDDIQQEIRTLKDPIRMENATTGVPVHLRKFNDGYSDYWKLERVNAT